MDVEHNHSEGNEPFPNCVACEPFDVDAAARAHYDRLMGHDLPLAERAARARRLSVGAPVRKVGP